MVEIAERLRPAFANPTFANTTGTVPFSTADGANTPRASSFPPPLTFDRVEQPAYFVNTRFEVEWYNEAARDLLFGGELPGDIRDRFLFDSLLAGPVQPNEIGLSDLISFHLSIAKRRLSKQRILDNCRIVGGRRGLIESLFDSSQTIEGNGIRSIDPDLAPSDRAPECYRVNAAFFREGTLFAYAPEESYGQALLDLLSRRDSVIRELLRRRQPYVTPVAALVADLQESVRICAGLPPEEYFELINGMWNEMEPVLRRHRATVGKHAGDGVVCFFFPQPDGSHVANAVNCALEMRELMVGFDRSWQNRKNWSSRLLLNIGIDEGEEWFGTFQSASHLQFTVLGDTVNQAARLSDFARDGSVWVTKNLVGKLSPEDRAGLRWGIRRGGENAPLVASTYARVSDLADLSVRPKLADIATLPVTELVGTQAPAHWAKR